MDPESKRITSMIDWQSATALPFFYQCGIPAMFKYRVGGLSQDDEALPKRPANYSSLAKDERQSIGNYIGSECLRQYYLTITHNQNLRHWMALLSDDDSAKSTIAHYS